MLTCGIVGLPNVGKSTLFNALTHSGAPVSNYPFCTIEPNLGMVAVPDERLGRLGTLVGSTDITPATVKFLDIAGLVKGASQGEGLGNRFLGYIREVEAIVHVVRCFQDREIAHIESDIDPGRDIGIINLELALADLELVESRLSRIKKEIKAGKKGREVEKELLLKVRSPLEEGRDPCSLSFNPGEEQLVKNWNLLSLKPVIYLANVGEEMTKSPLDHLSSQQVRKIAEREKRELVYLSAKLEAEIAELGDEAGEFRKEMEISPDLSLTKLIQTSFRLLRLITFYTVVGGKVRAWTIPEGTKVKEAAGQVHSDMEKGFIRAEVVSFPDLDKSGSLAEARERGLVKIEGKEYPVREGDVIYFRFS